MDISLVVYHWYIHQSFLNAQTISGKYISGDLHNCGVRTNVYSHALWILYHAWTAHSKEPIDPHRQIKSVTWMIHKTDNRKLTPFSQILPFAVENGDWFLTVSVCRLKMVIHPFILAVRALGLKSEAQMKEDLIRPPQAWFPIQALSMKLGVTGNMKSSLLLCGAWVRRCTCKCLAWDLGSLSFFRKKFCIESMGRSQFYSLDTPFLILSLIFSHLCNRMNNFLFQKFSARCSHENSRAVLPRKCWAGSLGMWGPRSLWPWDQDVTQLAGRAGGTPSRWLAVWDVWVKELSLQIQGVWEGLGEKAGWTRNEEL